MAAEHAGVRLHCHVPLRALLLLLRALLLLLPLLLPLLPVPRQAAAGLHAPCSVHGGGEGPCRPEGAASLPPRGAQANNTLRIARAWRTAWAAAGAAASRVTVVAVAMETWRIPHIMRWFGSDISGIDAIAVSGSYGSLNSWCAKPGCQGWAVRAVRCRPAPAGPGCAHRRCHSSRRLQAARLL
jgi:hypothetical protein